MSDKTAQDILCKVDKKFTVCYKDGHGKWVELLPGLTGSYDWAQRVVNAIWLRDGRKLTPSDLRIYQAPLSYTSLPTGEQKKKGVSGSKSDLDTPFLFSEGQF